MKRTEFDHSSILSCAIIFIAVLLMLSTFSITASAEDPTGSSITLSGTMEGFRISHQGTESEPYNIIVTDSVTLTSPITISGGSYVTISGGGTIRYTGSSTSIHPWVQSMFDVEGATFVVGDVDLVLASGGYCIYVSNGTTDGKVILNNGRLRSENNQGTGIYGGWGILIQYLTNTVIEINGGSVSGFNVGIYTGQVFVTMNDGVISDCRVGCAFNQGGAKTFNGGSIISCNTGIELNENAHVEYYGGTISDCQYGVKGRPTSQSYKNRLHMYGGRITGCEYGIYNIRSCYLLGGTIDACNIGVNGYSANTSWTLKLGGTQSFIENTEADIDLTNSLSTSGEKVLTLSSFTPTSSIRLKGIPGPADAESYTVFAVAASDNALVFTDELASHFISAFTYPDGSTPVARMLYEDQLAFYYPESNPVACGHENIVIDQAVDATCTSEGLTEGSHCADCGEVLVPQLTVAMLPHSEEVRNYRAATETEDGYTGDVYCTTCGQLLRTGSVIHWETDPHEVYYEGGSTIDAAVFVGGTEDEPYVVHVLGSVKVIGTITMASGYITVVGDTNDAELKFNMPNVSTNVHMIDSTADELRMENLQLTGNTAGWYAGQGVTILDESCRFVGENVVFDSWTTCFQLNNSAGTAPNCYISNSSFKNSDRGFFVASGNNWGGEPVLQSCEFDHMKASVQGTVRLRECNVHDSERIRDSYAGDRIILQDTTVSNLSNLNDNRVECDLYISGSTSFDIPISGQSYKVKVMDAMADGAQIPVCEASNGIVAEAYNYAITDADAAYFSYLPSESELSGNLAFGDIFINGAGNLEVESSLESTEIHWYDTDTVNSVSLTGGTENEPLYVYVHGTVTVTDVITLTSGYVNFIGEDDTAELKFYMPNANTNVHMLDSYAEGLRMENLKLTGNTSGRYNGQGVTILNEADGRFVGVNLAFDGWTTCFQLNKSAGTDPNCTISNSCFKNSDRAIYVGSVDYWGGEPVLDNCEFYELKTAALGRVLLSGCNIHDSERFRDQYSGGSIILQDTAVTNISEMNNNSLPYTLYVSGSTSFDAALSGQSFLVRVMDPLTEGAQIPVCEASNGIVAEPYNYAITDADAAYFSYMPSESELGGNLAFGGIFVNDAGNLEVEISLESTEIHWYDTDPVSSVTLTGGTENEPLTVHIHGSVTVTDVITLTSGYVRIIGEDDAAELKFYMPSANTNKHMLDSSAEELRMENLKLTGNTSSWHKGQGVTILEEAGRFVGENLVFDSWTTCFQLNKSAGTEPNCSISNTSFKNSDRGFFVASVNYWGGEPVLQNCEFDQMKVSIQGAARLTSCNIHDSERIKDSYAGERIILQDTVANNVSMINENRVACDLYVSGSTSFDVPISGQSYKVKVMGSLTEGTQIPVCEASDGIVAEPYSYTITDADAACFSYVPSESEQNGNGIYSDPYLDLVSNQIKINIYVGYRIVFNANGGTNAPDMQKKIANEAISLTNAIPSREGYTFVGWAEFQNADVVAYVPGETFTKDEDTTLFAVWAVPDFVLPGSLSSIEASAFEGGAFTFVKAGTELIHISENTFADCPNMLYIEIPGSETSIDASAFGTNNDVIIIGATGSDVEGYARSHGFRFVPMQ